MSEDTEVPVEEGTSKKKEPPWKKYQEMSREEKRKFYECGGGFVPITKIKKWSEVYQNKREYFYRIQKSTKIKPVNKVDVKLNDKISLWEGDITTLEIDAIVNAANRSLLGGGGVDGCIHRAAGNSLVDECRLLNGCDTGDAKITSGHKLPAKWVIHTVGPIGKDKRALTSCYKNCLRIALENEVRTLAFCCVSTGIYGYPNEDAAEVALKTTHEWLENEDHANAVDRIIFCLFLDKDIKIYDTLMLKYFPTKESKEIERNLSESEKKENETKKSGDKLKDGTEKGNVESKRKRDRKKKDEGMKTGEESLKADEMKKVEAMQRGRMETDEAKVTHDESSSNAEGKNDFDKGTKKVEELQRGRKETDEAKVTHDESSSNAEGKNDFDTGTKKVEEMQRERKAKDKGSNQAEIPNSKKQRQDNRNENDETQEQQDEEMVEEEPQEKQEPNTEENKQSEGIQERDENMDVGEDLPKQETDEQYDKMGKREKQADKLMKPLETNL